jgi:hypothetical protein
MKLFLAIVVYALIGLLLGWGLLLAAKGSWWFLFAGFLTYLVLFAKIGCLPKSPH